MKVLEYPLAKIAIWFILGLLASFYLNADPKIFIISGCILLPATVLFYLSSARHLNQKNYFGIVACMIFFLAGTASRTFGNSRFCKNHYANIIEPEKDYLVAAILIENLKSGTRNERYIAKITSLDSIKAQGRILLNIKKESLDKKLEIGTRLLYYGKIYEHRKPDNPDQFDYGKYLERKSVYGQIYAVASDIKVNPDVDKSIWHYASAFRNRIIENLKKSGFSRDELNVAVALILGQQQDISPEILKDYQLAGAVHILSVSGLHVGFIMIAIGFLLKPLPKTKAAELFKLAAIITFLWLFALIAGFSPAVTRSAVMFSFVAVGRYANRKTNIFHTLIASMFFILLFQPSFIFDVGFQLSYSALFFIVWLKPLFDKVWNPDNKIMRYLWGILTVSFAAQIGTFPLSVYYFHQFPGLFFVTNLLVLPLLGVILALGIFVMIWAYVSAVPQFVAKAFEYGIFILNRIISWVASLETFVFRDISFSLPMMAASYLLILALGVWLMKPHFKKLAAALASLIVLQAVCLGTRYHNQRQEEFIVFNVKSNTVITERKGENLILYADSLLAKDAIDFAVKPYLVKNSVSISKIKEVPNLNYFGHKKIFIIDSLGIIPDNVSPDILILRRSPKINLERLLQHCRPKAVVADASNYKTYEKRWKETCIKEKIPFHSTREKGYYVLTGDARL